MATLFTKIISGEIPCQKIDENDKYLAFLDIRPVAKGHTLVIPKKEVDYIFDLDPELLSGIMPFAKHIAAALRKTIPCKRIGIMVAGLEVPHAHIHLIPIQSVGDLNFSKASDISQDELTEIRNQIVSNL